MKKFDEWNEVKKFTPSHKVRRQSRRKLEVYYILNIIIYRDDTVIRKKLLKLLLVY